MSKIGFWEGLFGDVGYYERSAINDNAESLSMMFDSQIESDAHHARQMQKLFALDRAQSKELARLRTMVRILSETVTELGFDRDRLARRMDDAIEDLESEASRIEGAAIPGGPYRGGGEGSQAPEPVTTCRACGKEVLLRRSNITANGTTCDPCFNK